MKKYNIIGDIHGRKCWKDLLIKDGINIFVGDYVSPYNKDITFENYFSNMQEIIDWKLSHMDTTILLIGNHDVDVWKWKERASRFDDEHEKELDEFFNKYKHLFTVAYSIENQALVTHAGVSYVWYFRRVKDKHISHTDYLDVKTGDVLKDYINNVEAIATRVYPHNPTDWIDHRTALLSIDTLIKYGDDLYFFNAEEEKMEKVDIPTPDQMAEEINKFFDENFMMFRFAANASTWDCYGDCECHSPLWIRPDTLRFYDAFFGKYIQIFGHTQSHGYNGISKMNDTFYMVDCLGYKKESLIICTDENKIIRICRNNGCTLVDL